MSTRVGRAGPRGLGTDADVANATAAVSDPAGGAGRMGRPARADLRLLIPACVAWASAVILHGQIAALWWTCAVLAIVTTLGLARLVRGASGGWLPLLTLSGAVTLVVLLAAATADLARTAGTVDELAAQRAVVRAEAVVTSDPRRLPATSERSSERYAVTIRIESVIGRGSLSRVGAPVLVIGNEAWSHVRWGERIRLTGRLAAAERGDDVVALVIPTKPPERLEDPPGYLALADSVRSATRAAMAGLPEDAAGLVPGLVIGDTSLASAELTADMRATGMTHLCAVSGSNVAIVLGAALALARAVGLPRRARPILAAALLVAFVILARPEPSVIRAAVMGGVGLLGMSASRSAAGVPALAAAVVLLLIADPWLATSYGFALSTLATLGLLLFTRPWSAALTRGLPPSAPAWVTTLAEAVTIPVAAQVMCAPVIVLLQGSVTLVGLLANLLAAPLVAPTTIAGVAVALLSVPLPVVAGWLAWCAAIPALGIAWIAHTFARVPYGAIPWPNSTAGALALAALTLLLVLTAPWTMRLSRDHPMIAGCAGLVIVAGFWPVAPAGWPMADWRFVVCDVGQGDALVVRTGEDRAVLIDVGPDPASLNACLGRLRITRLDAIVLTHYHADHVGGLAGALDGRSVAAIYSSPIREPAGEAAAVDALAAAQGQAVQSLAAGDQLRWGGIQVSVLAPVRRLEVGSVPNNNSLVLDVSQPGLRMLLMGDAEREEGAGVRRALTANRDLGVGTTPAAASPVPPPVVSYDIVKIAHHGSSNHDPELLAQTRPAAAVISVGADNDYGHPAPSVLTTLANLGVPVYRTDLDSDVMVGLPDGRLSIAVRDR